MSALTDPPARESIIRTSHWRAAHAFGTSLPGWLVVVPLRHVLSLDELKEEETIELGPLLRKLTAGLKAVTGCTKSYVILLAEAEGYGHVHFHVIPRMDWFTDEQRGPNVFSFLGQPHDECVPEAEQDRLALEIRSEVDA